MKKISVTLMLLSLLALTGTVLAVSAAEEGLQPALGSGTIVPPGITFAEENKVLEQYFSEDIEVIGRYDATIDPTANFTIEPINRDDTLEVKRNTPLGALDAVAQSGELNYTTYYHKLRDAVYVSSINEFEEDPDMDLTWFAFYELNDTFVGVQADTLNHTLSDGETFWFILCDLAEYNPADPRDFQAYWAVAGLSITVRFGEENVTPGPDGNVTPGPDGNVTPGPDGNVTPGPDGNVTPGPDGNVTLIPTTPGILVPIPPISPENVTPEPTPAVEMTIDEAIGEEENLSTLASLLNATDLAVTLRDEGPYTVFAPGNDAFGNLSAEELTRILISEGELTRVLSNHVVNGSYTAAELLNMTGEGNMTTLTTLAGTDLTVTANGSVLMVDNTTVVGPEINASNGVVHVIDAVLFPPENLTAQPVTTTTTPTVNATGQPTPLEQPTPLLNMTGFPEGAL